MREKRLSGLLPRPFSAWDLVAISTFLLLTALVTLSVGGKSYDDAFITHRYARNLALGRGFVYNLGDPQLGTTTPLLALLLAVFARVSSVDLIPEISQWLSGAALFLCALFAYLLARVDGRPVAGWVSALLLLLNPFFPRVWGGEALLLLALILGGIYSYGRGRGVLAGTAVGLAALTRGEGALAALVLAAHSIWVNRRIPWRAGLAFAAVVGTWTAYAWFVFASPLPSTLPAKMAQMESGSFSPFLWTSLHRLGGYALPGVSEGSDASLAYGAVFLLAAGGGIFLLAHPRSPYWLILAWVALYALGYAFLQVPFYHWYMAPLVLGGMILAGLGAQMVWEILDGLRDALGSGRRYVLYAVLALSVIAPLVRAGMTIRDLAGQAPSPAQRLYTLAGVWLRSHTSPEETVGHFEIGFVGYYSDRTMIDPVGLATPGASPHVARGDFLWAYLHHQPDYLLVNPVRWYDRIGRIRDEPWFGIAYEEAARIDEPGYFDSPLTIYRKVEGAAIPPPRH